MFADATFEMSNDRFKEISGKNIDIVLQIMEVYVL